jgi:hypothetical protein
MELNSGYWGECTEREDNISQNLARLSVSSHNEEWKFSGRIPSVCVMIMVLFTLEQATKAQRGSRCIALLFLQPRGRWGGWSTPRPGRFTLGKETRYPLYRRLGGPQGRSGRVQKISPPPGFDHRTVQSVASRYAVWAIPVPPSVCVISEISACWSLTSVTSPCCHNSPSWWPWEGPFVLLSLLVLIDYQTL